MTLISRPSSSSRSFLHLFSLADGSVLMSRANDCRAIGEVGGIEARCGGCEDERTIFPREQRFAGAINGRGCKRNQAETSGRRHPPWSLAFWRNLIPPATNGICSFGITQSVFLLLISAFLFLSCRDSTVYLLDSQVSQVYTNSARKNEPAECKQVAQRWSPEKPGSSKCVNDQYSLPPTSVKLEPELKLSTDQDLNFGYSGST